MFAQRRELPVTTTTYVSATDFTYSQFHCIRHSMAYSPAISRWNREDRLLTNSCNFVLVCIATIYFSISKRTEVPPQRVEPEMYNKQTASDWSTGSRHLESPGWLSFHWRQTVDRSSGPRGTVGYYWKIIYNHDQS
mgnify:FL=1